MSRQIAAQSTLRSNSECFGRTPPSQGTSLLLSDHTHTRNSETQSLAALTRASSCETSSSVPSSMGVRQLGSPTILSQDGAGALVATPRRGGALECPFNLLYCFQDFADERDWILHSLTHFKDGTPPKSNRCCFCEATFNSYDGIQSWQDRMNHVFLHHRLGHRLSHSRPDFQLYTYLWKARVISDTVYRDIKGNSEDRSRHVAAYPTPPVSPNERSVAVTETFTHRHRDRGP